MRPDAVYIHLGMNDFIKKKSGIAKYVQNISEHLLEASSAQICFSLIIESANDSNLNERIRLVNEEIHNYVSWLHTQRADARRRVFTFANNQLEDYNFYSVNGGFKLRERGQKKLWIRLREGLRKTLRLPRTNYHNSLQLNISTNKSYHE